jgi:NAD(P)-dependent dehydrogenase (short-subunit alcohol dehydrogenase family)
VNDMAESKGKTAAEMEDDFFKTIRPTSIIQRFTTVDEIAQMITFLASPLSSATNGASIRVDGGLLKTII